MTQAQANQSSMNNTYTSTARGIFTPTCTTQSFMNNNWWNDVSAQSQVQYPQSYSYIQGSWSSTSNTNTMQPCAPYRPLSDHPTIMSQTPTLDDLSNIMHPTWSLLRLKARDSCLVNCIEIVQQQRNEGMKL